jgi:hypothetical protein
LHPDRNTDPLPFQPWMQGSSPKCGATVLTDTSAPTRQWPVVSKRFTLHFRGQRLHARKWARDLERFFAASTELSSWYRGVYSSRRKGGATWRLRRRGRQRRVARKLGLADTSGWWIEEACGSALRSCEHGANRGLRGSMAKLSSKPFAVRSSERSSTGSQVIPMTS